MTNIDPILTVEKAAEWLRCSTRKIEDMARAGELPGNPKHARKHHSNKALTEGKKPATEFAILPLGWCLYSTVWDALLNFSSGFVHDTSADRSLTS